jgi:histidinol dehydrogenase
LKLVTGIGAGKEALSRARSLDLLNVPPHVQATTERVFGEPLTPTQTVQRIIDMVRSEGDGAIRRLTRDLDGVSLDALEVSRAEIKDSFDQVDARVIQALELSADRVQSYHRATKRQTWMDFNEGYGAIVAPLASVGAYVPGGSAPMPSTVIMSAVPARVAGVSDLLLCTPPQASGLPSPVTLVAASIAGVDRVFRIGGAQAVAAMAYGTETVPRVDMVCGPGNLFVTLAKKMVFGDVGIDGLFGPTETLIIADETANPTLCAVDLLAQAEHDPLAKPVLVTTSDRLARNVVRELDVRLPRLERKAIAGRSVSDHGCIVVVDSLDEALELSNWFAPEHLCLMVEDPWAWVGSIRNAGALFIGEFSHEVLGDYVAGPSHVMPTGGTARFSSGIGVHSFVKYTPVLALTPEVSLSLAEDASTIARAEGFTAHAEAAEVRQEMQSRPDGG